MTEFQKLCKGLGFIITTKYHSIVGDLDGLIAKLPFVNKKSLAVKQAYHLVRTAQAMYTVALILEDDKCIDDDKELLNRAMLNYFELIGEL